jgi:hypothetical protein
VITTTRIIAFALVLTTLLFAVGCGGRAMLAKTKGGGSEQGFPAPADVPGMSQRLEQPENPEGKSAQTMAEERTEIRPDGTVIRTVRTASTELGGSQDVADILRAYLGGEHFKRVALGLLLGLLAWLGRREWPVAAGVLALGAVATAFFGLPAVLISASMAGGLWLAWHILKSRVPIPLP